MTWLDRALCKLTGHKGSMLTFHQGRMYLRCHDCGYESAGWQVTAQRPKVRAIFQWRSTADQRERKTA